MHVGTTLHTHNTIIHTTLLQYFSNQLCYFLLCEYESDSLCSRLFYRVLLAPHLLEIRLEERVAWVPVVTLAIHYNISIDYTNIGQDLQNNNTFHTIM